MRMIFDFLTAAAYRMRLPACVLLLFAACAGLPGAALPQIRAERASAVYQEGEEILFRVTGGETGYTYVINDGAKVTKPQPLPAAIRCRAEKPGFVLVTVFCGKDAKGRPRRALAGAAVEPEKIKAGTARPEDFDAFWDNELKKLRANPMVIKETPVDAKLLPKGVKACHVTITRGDVTATGYVAWPAKAAPKSLPGCLTFLGASLVNANLAVPAKMAQRQRVIAFNLNFHGLPNDWPAVPKKDREKRKKVSSYFHKLADDRQSYAMRKIFLRTVLTADYLQQRPEFNGHKLATLGGSLGGCQSLVCAALVPQVTYCVAQASAMCDHFGSKAGHLPGWPNLLRNAPKAENNAPYYDMVSFAHRIKCPVRMSVGFIDTVCPPASTYAAYNALPVADKRMAHTVTGGHGGRIDKKDPDVFSLWHKELADYLK